MDDMLENLAAAPLTRVVKSSSAFTEIAVKSLECKEKALYYLGNADILRVVYSEEYDSGIYIPNRVDLGIAVKMLVLDSPLTRKYQKKDSQEIRETRFLKEQTDMKHSFLLYDDTVVFFLSGEEVTGLVIQSQPVADTMKQMFLAMWDR